MNYYRLNVGDFALMAEGLDEQGIGILVRLMNRFAFTEKPIKTQWVSLGFRQEVRGKALGILEALWEKTEDGWIYPPLVSQLSDYKENAEKNRANGRKGGRPKKSATVSCETQTEPSGFLSETQTEPDGKATNNQEPITNKETERKKKEKRQAITHAFNLDLLPSEWADYAKQVRPDLDPQTVFADFVFYFTKGRGAGELRSDKGWNQSWQGWVRRQKETRNAKPAGSTAHQQPEVFDEAYYEGSMNPDGTANWG